MYRYRIEQPDGSLTKPIGRLRLAVGVRGRAKKMSAPMRVRKVGGELGPAKSRRKAVASYLRALHGAKVSAWDLVPETGSALRVRKVKERTRILDTAGNYLVDSFWSQMVARYGPLSDMGTLSCRHIGATSSWSQHARWKALNAKLAKRFGFPTPASSAGANAIDIGARKRKVMDRIFYGGITHAELYEIENIIHWPTDSAYPLIWNPEGGLHRYVVPAGGSDHRDHVHADFRPTRQPPPDC